MHDLAEPVTISKTPVRKVVKRSSQRADGYFNSRKMGQWLPGESQGERAFIRLAEIDSRVTEIYAQPTELRHRSRYGLQTAFPDFAIKIDGAWEFHEVKEAAKYADPTVQEKLFWVGRELNLKGYSYSVTLAEVIKPLASSEPISDLLRRLHSVVPAKVRLAAGRLLPEGQCSISDFLGSAPAEATFQHVEALIAQGVLLADPTKSLHRETTIYARGSTPFPRLIPFTAPHRPATLPASIA